MTGRNGGEENHEKRKGKTTGKTDKEIKRKKRNKQNGKVKLNNVCMKGKSTRIRRQKDTQLNISNTNRLKLMR